MVKPVIEIKNLAKAYMIGHEAKLAPGTVTLRDTIAGIVRKPAELVTGHKLKKEKFWALKDVNLNIEQGDVVGIIGRNGSGKSTLLKVLSRIVEPTKGEIIMRGKIASLLEVGTGFHPELTGRENIYFNGSILGMKRKEIESKFDEIVAFSEVEKFLDTPVKFYSSGMYVRLAFSVAAHLEPDILIVDEVLAVGDAAFQKKCLGKMKDVAGQGRTVLFVSHSMASVQALCNKGVLMKEGTPLFIGNIQKAVQKYGEYGLSESGIFESNSSKREGEQDIKIKKVVLSDGKKDKSSFSRTDELKLNVKCEAVEAIHQNQKLHVDVNILNDKGEWIVCASGVVQLVDREFYINLGILGLYRGIYTANISILKDKILQDFFQDAFVFEVLEDNTMLAGVSGVLLREFN